MNLTIYRRLKEEFERLGYSWPDFHLIGIRTTDEKPNEFDDVFYLVANDELHTYTGTTNPGRHWLKNPISEKGAAVLKPGQWANCWELGRHKGLYKAWVQVRPVTVYRDNDRDEFSENLGIEETGLFGINIHRANESKKSTFIDKWSAGCQVLNDPQQYAEFIRLSELSGLRYFTYTLLNEF